MTPNRALLALIVVMASSRAEAQGYRVRVDAGGQAASYRGVQLDSIDRGLVVDRAIGGLTTPDGIAVRCFGTEPVCRFFRPGPARRGGPLTFATDVAVWGFGIPGLSLRGTGRFGTDVGNSDVWPGTRPSGELLEGYLEYASGPVTIQAGRQQRFSRLGAVGFDGGQVTARASRLGLEATAFGGWSLAQASALPTTSPALNPLDQFQPQQRFLTVGGEGSVSTRWGDARGAYQRQVDPRTDYFVSERAGFDVTLRPLAGFTLLGGGDYDMASAVWGNAEGSLVVADGPFAASVGTRRHRPYFDLWTIWGAFSPVPYRAEYATLRVKLFPQLTLSGRGETYRYDPSNADAPLVEVTTDGWRWSADALVTPRADLDLSAGARVEHGNGASSRGFDARITYRRERVVEVSVFGMALERPLEFRFDESQVWALGGQATWRPSARWTAAAGVSRYVETRDRPDAGSFDWNQVRAFVRITLNFGSSADRDALPPASPSPLSPLPYGRGGPASPGRS